MLILLIHEIAIRICGVFMNSVWHILRSENTIPMLQLDINISNTMRSILHVRQQVSSSVFDGSLLSAIFGALINDCVRWSGESAMWMIWMRIYWMARRAGVWRGVRKMFIFGHAESPNCHYVNVVAVEFRRKHDFLGNMANIGRWNVCTDSSG